MATWIELAKDDLVQAIKVLEMVPMRAGTPSSDYIKVTTGKKYVELALASSVSAVVRVPWKGQEDKEPVFIDRRLLIPFVMFGEKWKGNFSLSLDAGLLSIKQGSRQAELSLRADPVQGYGPWKDLSGMKELKLTDGLRGLLLASHSCSTADPALQHLNCVYISPGATQIVLATNQTVVFVGISKDKGNLKIPFPVGIIPLLEQGLVKGVIIEGNLVILDCECGYIQGTVSAFALKSFPKASIISQIKEARKWPMVGKIPTLRLTRMLERLAGYLVGAKREDWALRLEISDGKLKAIVRIRQGVFEEKMDVDGLKGDLEMEWPLELVQPVLKYMGENSEEVKIRVDESKKTPYLISAAGIDLLVGRRGK